MGLNLAFSKYFFYKALIILYLRVAIRHVNGDFAFIL